MHKADVDENATAPRDSRHVAWLIAALMVAVIAAFFVLREHWGHALGYAPYLLLLACPFMHLFMHHGHGSETHRSDAQHRSP